MFPLFPIVESTPPVLVATGYRFTEGPLWDPQGFFYFSDVHDNALYRLHTGQSPVRVRTTVDGNGTCFSLDGKIIQCEGQNKRLTLWDPSSQEAVVLLDRIDGKKINRPNDVICGRDGSIIFTDPDKRVAFHEREFEAGVWRIAPDGQVYLLAQVEYPNGLAFSDDEKKLYIANTKHAKYILELTLDDQLQVCSKRIFADMSCDSRRGAPDGIKLDTQGHVYCSGPGGIWVWDADGAHLGVIELPEQAVNFAFGGDDMKTLLVCAQKSLYTLRMKIPGLQSPWQKTAAPRPIKDTPH